LCDVNRGGPINCHLTHPAAAMFMRQIVLVWLAALPMTLALPIDRMSPADTTLAFYRCQTGAAAAQLTAVSACFPSEETYLWDDEYESWFASTAGCLTQAARAAISTTWVCRQAFDESELRILDPTDAVWDGRGNDWY